MQKFWLFSLGESNAGTTDDQLKLEFDPLVNKQDCRKNCSRYYGIPGMDEVCMCS